MLVVVAAAVLVIVVFACHMTVATVVWLLMDVFLCLIGSFKLSDYALHKGYLDKVEEVSLELLQCMQDSERVCPGSG